MTTRTNPTFSPPPLIHAKSSPTTNQLPTSRPHLTTPTRDGRSRSANNVNSPSAPLNPKPEAMTFDNFNDVIAQKIPDPLYNDSLARLNNITTSLSQHIATLNSYAKKYSSIDTQEKAALENIRDATESLERDAHSRLNTAIPAMAEQNRIMENIERRVERARTKLAEQSDMLAEIDFKIAENRRMMSLPPPSSRNIISAPPLRRSRENSLPERSASFSSQPTDSSKQSDWKCRIL